MNESAEEIEAAAAQWVMRLDRHGDSVRLRAEIEAWTSLDDRRRGALLQAEALWAAIGMNGKPIASAPNLASLADEAEEEPRSGHTRRYILGGGAALAASVAAGIVIPFWRNRHDTDIGEIRRITLADGSLATINTASEINVSLGRDKRVIDLAKGEAWFDVTKDASRPFVVRAGSVHVQAIGTAFSVRRESSGAQVLVTEGVVEAWIGDPASTRTRLVAGSSAFLSTESGAATTIVGQDKVDQALAWREGKIDLNGRTLDEAAQEFNRYNKRQIIIGDPALSSERLFGIFKTDDPEGFANTVQRSLDTRVDLTSPDTITIG
ncbi:MAG: iron dicitrate transport regulator FecR [Bradyrhizobium sp.]|nr:iron dicitrate transport regulator FecR [Bradyrhizobium sp.]